MLIYQESTPNKKLLLWSEIMLILSQLFDLNFNISIYAKVFLYHTVNPPHSQPSRHENFNINPVHGGYVH